MNYKYYNPRKAALDTARELLTGALNAAVADGSLPEAPLPEFIVEIPADVKNGDIASNAAMAGARAFHKAPRQIAQAIVDHLNLEGSLFDRAEIAGPGFINLFLGAHWFTSVLQAAATEPEYGRTDGGAGKRYNVEFVSANPTGPMHMGNARGGALGDCLAACLDWAGYDVTREFYINDAGNQIQKFGKSLAIRYLQLYKGEEAVPLPEECYQGADIIARAKEFAEIHGDSYVDEDFEELKEFVRKARFDRMGAFAYSEEEGTYAAKQYEDSIPQEVKQARLDELMDIQQGISAELSAAKIGQQMKVIIDRIEGDYYIGRTEFDSPEVDPEVLISHSGEELEIGQFYRVEVTDADDFDLYAKIMNKYE